MNELVEKEIVTRPSSLASESAFSAAKWLICDRRCLLSDQSIRALPSIAPLITGVTCRIRRTLMMKDTNK